MSQNCDNIKNCISEKDAMDYWNQVNDEYKNELDIIVKTVLLVSSFHFVVYWAFLVELGFYGNWTLS